MQPDTQIYTQTNLHKDLETDLKTHIYRSREKKTDKQRSRQTMGKRHIESHAHMHLHKHLSITAFLISSPRPQLQRTDLVVIKLMTAMIGVALLLILSWDWRYGKTDSGLVWVRFCIFDGNYFRSGWLTYFPKTITKPMSSIACE